MNCKVLATSLLLLTACEKRVPDSHDDASLDGLTPPQHPTPTQREASTDPREEIRAYVRIRPRTANDSLYAGAPRSPKKLTVLRNIGYACGYDETSHTPAWVSYRITKHGEAGTDIQAPNQHRPTFETDPRTQALIKPSLFSRSGFDRGHMAANEVIGIEYGSEAQRETFKMSNIAPQTPAFNRGIWKHFETAEMNYWASDREELWVTVGAVVSESSRSIRKDGKTVAIPTSFYRIYLDEENGEITPLAFTVQQEESSRPVEVHTIREIEELTHLDFNPDLPRPAQDYLEQLKAPRIWRTHKR